MPVFNTKDLLASLTEDVNALLKHLQQVKQLDSTLLLTQPAAGKWSVIQILEHLNSYNRYYLPAIEKSLQNKQSFNPQFKSGWFGDYFTKMMMPGKDGKVANKMNSPKDHRPIAELNAAAVVTEFINGQQHLLTLLQKATNTDIGRVKVPISISRFIKLKLGDTFRFLIAHQQRHFLQLENTLSQLS